MNDWSIGISTGCFYQTSIFDCLPVIRENGFNLIEVCFSPAHLDYHDSDAVHRAASRVAELGMSAYSFHAPFAANIDISSTDPHQRDLALAEILRAAEAAAILSVRYFVMHPGPEQPATRPADERFERMKNSVAVLDAVSHRCHELGITCVLENKLPHLLFGNSADVLWILDAMKRTDVGACLDTGHGFLSGDLPSMVHKLAGHLKMIHAHDNRGHGDDHLPPGDGCIDWPRLLSQLARFGFGGAFILELAGAGDAATTMANARRGRSFLIELARRLAFTESSKSQ